MDSFSLTHRMARWMIGVTLVFPRGWYTITSPVSPNISYSALPAASWVFTSPLSSPWMMIRSPLYMCGVMLSLYTLTMGGHMPAYRYSGTIMMNSKASAKAISLIKPHTSGCSARNLLKPRGAIKSPFARYTSDIVAIESYDIYLLWGIIAAYR